VGTVERIRGVPGRLGTNESEEVVTAASPDRGLLRFYADPGVAPPLSSAP
jgi:hypothetical protein